MNIEALLRDRDWVRRLARSLARDDAQADDLAQDGWLSALKSPPGRAARAWWRRVLRRRAMEMRREEDRRAAREERRPQPRPVGPELLERLELEQAVAQAVGGLPEHYRDVVLLRYFEELPPRAIAKRLGVPVETVRTRLKRAHEMLRERLGEARRDWRAGMLLLGWPGSLLGGIAVETKKVAAGAVVLGLLLFSVLVWRGGGGNQTPERTTEARRTAPAPVSDVTPPTDEAKAAATRAPGGAVFGRIEGPLPVLKGTEPLAVVRVLRGGAEIATGRFPPGPFRVEYDRAEGSAAEVHAPGTRMQTFALPSAETDLGEIRFYQALLYGGRVLDLEGNPIVGATVQFRDPSQRAVWVSEPTAEDGEFRVDLDWDTHFSLDRSGNVAGALLDVHVNDGWLGPYYASSAGFRGGCDLRVDLGEVDADPVLRIVAAGVPVVGTHVAIHEERYRRWPTLPEPWATGVTDEDGCVRIPWPPEIESALIRIDKRGSVVDVSQRRDEIGRPVHEIDVGSVAQIAAQFVRPDGKPADGAHVWLGGEWMPDTPGKPVSSPRAASPAYVPGSVTASLYGVVPRDGLMRWSVPVERPEGGTFHPHGWFGSLPQDRPLGRDIYGTQAVRAGDPPIRIVLEDQPSEQPRVYLRFRDSRGPVVPQSVGFRLLRDGTLVEAGSICPSTIAGDSVLCWLSFDARDFDFDSVDVYVRVDGRAPATARLPATDFLSAIREGTDLRVEVGGTGAAVFRIARPNGEPAKDVLVALVPGGADHASAGAQRLVAMTDDVGGVVMGCQADLAYAVMAFDMATGEGARIDGFRAGGVPRDLVLETPRRTRVRILFPDGAPAPKTGIDVDTRPRYLAPALHGVADEDGWVELPRIVPSLFVLDIKACDRRLELKPYLPGITHRASVPMASIEDGGTFTVPMLEEIARALAESK